MFFTSSNWEEVKGPERPAASAASPSPGCFAADLSPTGRGVAQRTRHHDHPHRYLRCRTEAAAPRGEGGTPPLSSPLPVGERSAAQQPGEGPSIESKVQSERAFNH